MIDSANIKNAKEDDFKNYHEVAKKYFLIIAGAEAMAAEQLKQRQSVAKTSVAKTSLVIEIDVPTSNIEKNNIAQELRSKTRDFFCFDSLPGDFPYVENPNLLASLAFGLALAHKNSTVVFVFNKNGRFSMFDKDHNIKKDNPIYSGKYAL